MIENQEQKKQLDTLARLLTGISKNKKDKRERDKSVAVCYHEGKLFVASNKKKPEYAKEYLEDLQKFANNPSSSNYENLLKRAARKIHNVWIWSRSPNSSTDSINIPTEEQNSESVLQKFQEKARECEESQQPDWNGLQVIAEKLFRENVSRGWELLTLWHDTAEIGKLDKNIIEIIRLQGEEEVDYVESEEEEENSEKRKKTHAEMKIINKLYRRKSNEEETQETRYY